MGDSEVVNVVDDMAEHIKYARTKPSMEQVLNVHKETVNKAEKGKNNPETGEIVHIPA